MGELENRILLDALVSYADACTMPALTPTCPFYRLVDGRPFCEEQCRDIAEARGAEPRRIRTSNVGGLVLSGREIPVRTMSGTESFDAGELRLRHKEDNAASQPTASLIAGLVETVMASATKQSPPSEQALGLWGELERRNYPIERVARHSIARTAAPAITLSVLLPLLVDEGLTPFGRDSDVFSKNENPSRSTWAAALKEAFDQYPSAALRQRHSLEPIDAPALRSRLGGLVAATVPDEDFELFLEKVKFAPFLLSNYAMARVHAWIGHLFRTDLEAALAASPPAHAATFAAVPPYGVDEEARWLGDRFLYTDLDRWAPTSLTLEWRHQSGHRDTDCPLPLLQERKVDRTLVGERALAALGDKGPRRPSPQPLDSSMFVRSASQALSERQFERAIAIFRGVTEMFPTEVDAWNNLGFCQLASDPIEALRSLEYAASLRGGNTIVCAANRTLALHQLKRDEEATEVGRRALADAATTYPSAIMWAHPSQEVHKLDKNVEPRAYLTQLLMHIEAGRCPEPGSDRYPGTHTLE